MPTGDGLTPMLTLTLHDLLDSQERKEYFAKVNETWIARNQKDLENELRFLSEDLAALSPTAVRLCIPITTQF